MNRPKQIQSFEKHKRDLEIREKELSVSELQLKIRDLKRPWIWRSNLLLILIALGGVLAQNYISAIHREDLNLQMSKTKDSLVVSQRLNDRMQYEYHLAQTRIDSANKTLSELSKRVTAFFSKPPDTSGYDSVQSLIHLLGSSLFYIGVFEDKVREVKGKPINIDTYCSLPCHIYIVMGDKMKAVDEREILNVIVNKLYHWDMDYKDPYARFTSRIYQQQPVLEPIVFYIIAVSKYGDIATRRLSYDGTHLIVD